MNNGAYDLEGVIWHQTSPRLMLKILELWPDKSVPVIDLGCGMNYYCSVLEYAGYYAIGLDGVKLKGVDFCADITDSCFLYGIPEVTRNVISLEVGEHLPANLSGNYIDNLTSFGGDIILSWAIPGQAGIGHVNCRSNSWVTRAMNQRGYAICLKRTEELRAAVQGCHCSWFVNTLMYYTPKK